MPVPFLKSRDSQCKFPLWGPNDDLKLVCGEPVQEGSSYCPTCHARCRQPATRPVIYYRDLHDKHIGFVMNEVHPDLLDELL